MNDMVPTHWDETPGSQGEVISPPKTTRPVTHNPFEAAAPEHVNAGTVAIEGKRAAAEIQGRMIVAKQWPRDTAVAYARAMQACQRPGLAEAAIYRYSRGQTVEGPSIRLAEELARCWGNIEYGLRELSRRDGESEMEAFAWDLETNTRSTQNFTVKHIRDKRGGGQALKEERDIYEITANMGARRLRSRILAILPPELIDGAVKQCRETIKSGGRVPLADRIAAMTGAFGQIGVTVEMIAGKVGHAVDQINPDELVDLRSVLQSIKDGQSSISDWFGAKKAEIAKDTDAFEKAAAGQSDPVAA